MNKPPIVTNKWKAPIRNPVVPKTENISLPPKRPSIQELEGQVKAWNDRFKPGQRVEVTLDSGKIFESRSSSSAWMLGGHSPVLLVEGLSGAFKLDRCRGVERFGSEVMIERDQAHFGEQ